MRIQRTLTVRQVRESDKEGHGARIALTSTNIAIVQKHMEGKVPEDWLFINPVTYNHYTQDRAAVYWRQYSGTDVTHYGSDKTSHRDIYGREV